MRRCPCVRVKCWVLYACCFYVGMLFKCCVVVVLRAGHVSVVIVLCKCYGVLGMCCVYVVCVACDWFMLYEGCAHAAYTLCARCVYVVLMLCLLFTCCLSIVCMCVVCMLSQWCVRGVYVVWMVCVVYMVHAVLVFSFNKLGVWGELSLCVGS